MIDFFPLLPFLSLIELCRIPGTESLLEGQGRLVVAHLVWNCKRITIQVQLYWL
jgi:hypothetical protein